MICFQEKFFKNILAIQQSLVEYKVTIYQNQTRVNTNNNKLATITWIKFNIYIHVYIHILLTI